MLFVARIVQIFKNKMNLNINLEKLSQFCRICLKNGDVNIWNCKITLKQQPAINDVVCTDALEEKSFTEIMNIFSNNQDLLNFTDEFPLLCFECLEDLKFCYITYEKIRLANIQLKNIYEESLNQCIEEEHLIEVVNENELSEITDTALIETLEENIINIPQNEFDTGNEEAALNKSNKYKQIHLDKNDSFIVTQFVPETLEANQSNDDDLFQPPHLLTVNLKAVEVKDFSNLGRPESSQTLSADITEPAIYICQYCPQAFTKSDYLKTHVQKSHVCKFCTIPFNLTEDLFRHIREVHTENKCAICHKILSSSTNLRHHIKRVHQVNLPAKVTLIDFIKSTSLEENKLDNEVETLQELETTDTHLDMEYVWTSDNCIEMLTENNETK